MKFMPVLKIQTVQLLFIISFFLFLTQIPFYGSLVFVLVVVVLFVCFINIRMISKYSMTQNCYSLASLMPGGEKPTLLILITLNDI